MAKSDGDADSAVETWWKYNRMDPKAFTCIHMQMGILQVRLLWSLCWLAVFGSRCGLALGPTAFLSGRGGGHSAPPARRRRRVRGRDSGNTFFTQSLQKLNGFVPACVHAIITFQFLRHGRVHAGQRSRLREKGLWSVDDNGYNMSFRRQGTETHQTEGVTRGC
jgi:hypothetical protein